MLASHPEPERPPVDGCAGYDPSMVSSGLQFLVRILPKGLSWIFNALRKTTVWWTTLGSLAMFVVLHFSAYQLFLPQTHLPFAPKAKSSFLSLRILTHCLFCSICFPPLPLSILTWLTLKWSALRLSLVTIFSVISQEESLICMCLLPIVLNTVPAWVAFVVRAEGSFLWISSTHRTG